MLQLLLWALLLQVLCTLTGGSSGPRTSPVRQILVRPLSTSAATEESIPALLTGRSLIRVTFLWTKLKNALVDSGHDIGLALPALREITNQLVKEYALNGQTALPTLMAEYAFYPFDRIVVSIGEDIDELSVEQINMANIECVAEFIFRLVARFKWVRRRASPGSASSQWEEKEDSSGADGLNGIISSSGGMRTLGLLSFDNLYKTVFARYGWDARLPDDTFGEWIQDKVYNLAIAFSRLSRISVIHKILLVELQYEVADLIILMDGHFDITPELFKTDWNHASTSVQKLITDFRIIAPFLSGAQWSNGATRFMVRRALYECYQILQVAGNR